MKLVLVLQAGNQGLQRLSDLLQAAGLDLTLTLFLSLPHSALCAHQSRPTPFSCSSNTGSKSPEEGQVICAKGLGAAFFPCSFLPASAQGWPERNLELKHREIRVSSYWLLWKERVKGEEEDKRGGLHDLW